MNAAGRVDLTDLVGLQRIRAFAADYHADSGTRRVTQPEQALVEEALVSYFLVEEYLTTPAKERVASALHALADVRRRLPPIAQPTVRLIEQCILDLSGRLQRREETNQINMEHQIMLSETIRQLRDRDA